MIKFRGELIKARISDFSEDTFGLIINRRYFSSGNLMIKEFLESCLVFSVSIRKFFGNSPRVKA